MTKATDFNDVQRGSFNNAQWQEMCIVAPPDGHGSAGTIALLEENGGGVSITTSTTDNNLAYIQKSARTMNLAGGYSVALSGILQFSEANTNAANIFVGLTNIASAAVLQDDGAGLISAFKGVGFFKVDGGVNLQVGVGNGTDANETKEIDNTANQRKAAVVAGSASDVPFRIGAIYKTSTKIDVVFWWNGVEVYKITDYDPTGMGLLAPCFAVKCGSTTAEVLKLRMYNASVRRAG